MFVGRTCGWLLVALAILLASGDAVLALGPVEYITIATGDVVTLLAGAVPPVVRPDESVSFTALGLKLLQLPAWMVMGPMGASLVFLCRSRRCRRRLFRRAAA